MRESSPSGHWHTRHPAGLSPQGTMATRLANELGVIAHSCGEENKHHLAGSAQPVSNLRDHRTWADCFEASRTAQESAVKSRG